MPDGDNSEHDGVAIQDYWAALRVLGLRGATRLSEENYLMTTRENDTVTVKDPSKLTPVERAAVLELLRMRLS
ncbi:MULTISPECIES: hypothetical protein [Hyphomonas]|mgnify:CR=1 FL=1|uniref:Uncharacterized protein n=1 Tax=Hyphomonas adhaerens TaxID=81029 RepID=A0A3B9H334_9PROT|nr:MULTISPECIES: hypothetical protein [Hyphomonas]MBB41320.1 hypothetical protein [Hyphomonas sp.]HAE29115.1 hypothetical protein [Hyphomonas adhaerens]|tara:strand:+ start:83 stop:301 length:219 start_codon:yes stop_codon:yes gene_type:complete